jgi:hypothetical protein
MSIRQLALYQKRFQFKKVAKKTLKNVNFMVKALPVGGTKSFHIRFVNLKNLRLMRRQISVII